MYFIKTSDEILDPLRIFVSDKEYAKIYIGTKVGDQFNVPTLAILRDKESAAQYNYPDRCVIKPTHLSGRIIFRKRDEKIDLRLIENWFSQSVYSETREANYRYLRPKVIVEPLLFDGENLPEFNIFCVDGATKLVQVHFDRWINHTQSLYSVGWSKQSYATAFPVGHDIAPPTNLSEMLEVAQRLAAEFTFIRVDLYSDGKRIYVGELTNCPGNACIRFCPPSGEGVISALLFK